MTLKEKKEIAKYTAQYLVELQKEQLERPVGVKGAAEILGWKPRTVYARKEKLGGWKSGGTLYFKPSHLIYLINNSLL